MSTSQNHHRRLPWDDYFWIGLLIVICQLLAGVLLVNGAVQLLNDPSACCRGVPS